MIANVDQVKQFIHVHGGTKLYKTDWADSHHPLLYTTVYTGTDLWKLFAKQVTISADRIVNEALDHPAIYLNVADTTKGRPWPVGNNITLLPQCMAKVAFVGCTRDDHLAAVLSACAARWLVDDPNQDISMVYLSTPWLYRLEDRLPMTA